jgi:hypothetical protein
MEALQASIKATQTEDEKPAAKSARPKVATKKAPATKQAAAAATTKKIQASKVVRRKDS